MEPLSRGVSIAIRGALAIWAATVSETAVSAATLGAAAPVAGAAPSAPVAVVCAAVSAGLSGCGCCGGNSVTQTRITRNDNTVARMRFLF